MKRYPLRKNQFYYDPLDLWFESHPIVGGIILGAMAFALIFLACLL